MNKIINNILESFDIILNENKSSLNEVSSTSSSLFGGSSVKIPADGAHAGQSGWQSNNAWDIPTPIGSPVYAVADGVVATFTDYGPTPIRKHGKTLFGAGFTVNSSNGLPNVYYTHLKDCTISQGSNVKCGQLLGYIMDFPGSDYDHLHIGVETGHNIKEFLNANGTLKCGGSITGELSEPVKSTDTSDSTTQSKTKQPVTTKKPDDDQFGINNIDTNDPVYSTLVQAASKFGLKEEKKYSKLIKDILSLYDTILENKDISEATDVYNDVDFKDYAVGKSTPSKDTINVALLQDIQTAAKAAGVKVDITTAVSGHDKGTRHETGNAVDIAIINGKSVSRSNRSDTDKLVSALVSMGYVKNSEKGNPKAVLTFGFKNHDDHVHISNQGTSSSAIQPATTQPETTQPETTQPETTQSATTQSATTQSATTQSGPTKKPDDDQFGINNIDTNAPEYSALTQAASKFGLKEEKIYSKLGNRISVNNRSIILPKNDNYTIKSPVNGVINNYRSNRYCVNQLTIQHSIEDKKYYLQFCNISDPQVNDGRKVSKGDVLGKTSTDVTVSLFDKVWNQIYLSKMLDKEISTNVISKKKSDNNKDNDKKDDNNKGNNKKETEYYDPIYPWLGKKIFDIGKKIQDKMPSMTKGGEPKTKNFFNKYGMTNKKVDENIERIKTLLK